MGVIEYIGTPCIELSIARETYIIFASFAKLPSFAKLVFSADSNLGDGVIVVAMQEIA